jgi:hypothetical protein
MKTRILTVIAILVLSGSLLEAQVDFGIVAGPSFQNITGTNDGGSKLENGLLTSFHAGVQVSLPIATDFYFQTGLLYSQKGARNNFFQMAFKASGDYNTTTRISYLELPLNLLFRPGFYNGHILVGFGPYVAYGIGGSQKYEEGSFAYTQDIRFANEVISDDFYWDMENTYYRAFDAGANIFVGYEFEMGLFFHLNAQLGLLKINPTISDDSETELSYKNTGFGLSVGYNF